MTRRSSFRREALFGQIRGMNSVMLSTCQCYISSLSGGNTNDMIVSPAV